MNNWRTFNDDSDAWDFYVQGLSQSSVFHSSRWANLQQSTGWNTHRYCTSNARSAIQVFSKPYGRIASLGWCPGGLAGDQVVVDQDLWKLLEKEVGGFVSYCRLARPIPTLETRSVSHPWRKTALHLGARESVQLNLEREVEELLKQCGPNWRRNLKRASRANLTIRRLGDDDFASINHLEREMIEFKRIRQPNKSFGDIMQSLGNQIILFGAFDQEGVLVAARGASTFGAVARDLLAATNVAGRKTYASYLTMWTLIQALKQASIARYDLGGIDYTQNSGVANFKIGTGGHRVRYPEEVAACTYPFLAPIINRLLVSLGR